MTKKTTLTQLSAAFDRHSRSFDHLSAAIGDEKKYAIETMKRTGLKLIEAIENGVTKSCDELLPMAERLIDTSTQKLDDYR